MNHQLKHTRVRAPAKVNWGRSVVSTSPGAENQLVRVALPRSEDLTLYLQPAREKNGLPSTGRLVSYRVTIGTGGIAVTQTWIPCPQFGVVRHFVADLLEVTVTTPIGASAAFPLSLSANSAIGRPSALMEAGSQVGSKNNNSPTLAEMASYLTKAPTANGWIGVSPGTGFQPLIRIPTFATRMEVEIYNPSGVADADMQLWGITPNGSESVIHQLVSTYADPQPIGPEFCLFNFRNNDAANTYFVLVNFTIGF